MEDIFTKSSLPGILATRLFNQHQILLARNPGNKTPTVWELVDQDLHDRRCNPEKFAFAELIIECNHQLWDGIKTNDIPEEDQQLPMWKEKPTQ
ncbi:hypothetical protein VP01_665g2 [Puccinia sorghi]|uniref:Uncharacterized protein n=1 Tax=Puccinia sorghi TaxID=27349 RepID=A0A0L6UEZ4_9BASI|nr:hypothetical protein VP01_665g2 [Puccinia sorghi]